MSSRKQSVWTVFCGGSASFVFGTDRLRETWHPGSGAADQTSRKMAVQAPCERGGEVWR